MESLIATIQEKINSGLSFDLELLLDAVVEAVNKTKEEQKEVLHSLGQGYQRYYDERIRALRLIVSGELTNLKSIGSDCCEDKQRQYRLFKSMMLILDSIQIVF
jgi:hypothetical protein